MQNEEPKSELPAQPSDNLRAVDSTRLLAYERLSREIWKNILTMPGESVLIRHAFRWHKNGEVVCNAYESRELKSLCEEHGWKVVQTLGEHIAIISQANPGVEGRTAKGQDT